MSPKIEEMKVRQELAQLLRDFATILDDTPMSVPGWVWKRILALSSKFDWEMKRRKMQRVDCKAEKLREKATAADAITQQELAWLLTDVASLLDDSAVPFPPSAYDLIIVVSSHFEQEVERRKHRKTHPEQTPTYEELRTRIVEHERRQRG